MENELNPVQRDHYLNTVIPKLEEVLASDASMDEKQDAYLLYVDVLRLVAREDFISFNKYLELDEDHNNPNKAFYHHRKDHMGVIFQTLNDMEIHDKYDMVLISTPPRTGKTTTGVRFLSWVCGRHPESTELATSYSDSITTSFYIGSMEIMQSDRYRQVFDDAYVVNQNAKREEIWLKVMRRYPTITFVPVGGSMTGRSEAGKYLYCDDLVSGIEEAMSKKRLEKLWQLYTVNLKQRKKDGCKEIHIATQWSVHDPINKLARENKDNPRCKIIKLPCYDENGESAFNFFGGFTTKYYKDLEKSMDPITFGALYKCQSVEREGLLYKEDELNYYTKLPKERPDTVIAICDSKNLGKDHVASPIGYVYGNTVYIEDVVYNSGLPEVTRPLVANKWDEHNVVRADVELNNGGNYYAEDLGELLEQKGATTSIRMFFSSNNKTTKIITYADYVKKNFVFKPKSQYHPNSEYAKFMEDLFSWTQTGTNTFDDAPDSLAMLAQMVQELDANVVKTMDRRKLRL